VRVKFVCWENLLLVRDGQLYPAQYIEHTPNNGKRNYLHYMDGPYVAGNYEFDPLSLYESLGDDASGRRAMRELEVGGWVYDDLECGIDECVGGCSSRALPLPFLLLSFCVSFFVSKVFAPVP